MIIIVSTLLGVLLGIRGATKRGGKTADKAQWAAGYGIAFAILGLFLSIAIEQLAL